MTENANFKRILADSGMTMYALAKRSGIPYTTINEIYNGKNDINQCAAGTVHRLAAILGVTTDSLMNPINYLDGVKGRHKGIDYIWSTDECSCITFEYEGKPVTLSAGAIYNIPSRIDYYNIIAGWMVEDYIEDMEWHKSIQPIIERIQNGR